MMNEIMISLTICIGIVLSCDAKYYYAKHAY